MYISIYTHIHTYTYVILSCHSFDVMEYHTCHRYAYIYHSIQPFSKMHKTYHTYRTGHTYPSCPNTYYFSLRYQLHKS